MAPRKRNSDGEAVKPDTTSSRVTRTSTRRLNGKPTPVVSVAASDSPKKKKKKAKTSSSNTKVENAKAKEDQPPPPPPPPTKVVEGAKTIVIEHCKQCNSFKTRAIQVKNGLENGLSSITVVLNPEKPRRGCFEIREEGGEKFISLLDMKRPFGAMKALDMDKVISDIIDQIK